MIDLIELKRLQKYGGIVKEAKGVKWEYLDLPEDLIISWKNYIKTRNELVEVLIKHDVINDITDF